MEIIKLEGIGYIKFHVNEGDKQISSFIELMSIYVEPNNRKEGYASVLIKMLRGEARRRCINTIYVKVTKTNREFKRFLEKNDFRLCKEKELFYGYTFKLSECPIFTKIRCKDLLRMMHKNVRT